MVYENILIEFNKQEGKLVSQRTKNYYIDGNEIKFRFPDLYELGLPKERPFQEYLKFMQYLFDQKFADTEGYRLVVDAADIKFAEIIGNTPVINNLEEYNMFRVFLQEVVAAVANAINYWEDLFVPGPFDEIEGLAVFNYKTGSDLFESSLIETNLFKLRLITYRNFIAYRFIEIPNDLIQQRIDDTIHSYFTQVLSYTVEPKYEFDYVIFEAKEGSEQDDNNFNYMISIYDYVMNALPGIA